MKKSVTDERIYFKVDNEFIFWRTPEEYIELMFERTFPDGKLVEPVFSDIARLPGTENNRSTNLPMYSHRCVMNWADESDRDRIIKDFSKLYVSLSKIAKQYKRLSNSEEENAKLLSPELLKVWSTYVRKFNVESFVDIEKIKAFNERLERIKGHSIINLKGELCMTLDENETAIFQNYQLNDLRPSEKKYYDKFLRSLIKQAKQRIGKPLMAYTLIRCTQRLVNRMTHDAPQKQIAYEARRAAQAFAINACADDYGMYFVNGNETLVEWCQDEGYYFMQRTFSLPDSISVDAL